MIRRLLLLSSGTDKMMYKPLLSHLHKPPRDMHICFITTASDLEPDKTYVQHEMQALRSWGFHSIQPYDLKGKTIFQLKEDLPKFDIFYVCGGSAFHLLRHVQLSRFDLMFPPLLSQGKIYIGESAGAYLACPTIEAATWHTQPDPVELPNLESLHLVPFLIKAHYTPEKRVELESFISHTYHPVVALTDQQGIMAVGHRYHFTGAGIPHTFNNFELNPES